MSAFWSHEHTVNHLVSCDLTDPRGGQFLFFSGNYSTNRRPLLLTPCDPRSGVLTLTDPRSRRFGGPGAQFKSDAVPYGPMWSDAVISHTRGQTDRTWRTAQCASGHVVHSKMTMVVATCTISDHPSLLMHLIHWSRSSSYLADIVTLTNCSRLSTTCCQSSSILSIIKDLLSPSLLVYNVTGKINGIQSKRIFLAFPGFVLVSQIEAC